MSPPSLSATEAGADASTLPSSELAREQPPARRETSSKRAALFVVLSVLGFGALFLAGYLPKRAQNAKLAASALAGQRVAHEVSLVKPKLLSRERALKLPATLDAHEQTVIHARANGYVRRWLVDLGERVKAGQLLAEIDTPELDRELDQARAGLSESEASVELARASREYATSSLERYQQLTQRKLTSAQELERYQAEARVNDARVQVAEAERASRVANLRRLEQLKAFSQVSAPFAGVVTSRTIERGALVSSGVASPLFELATVDALRVTVDVPQSWAPGVRTGHSAQLALPEYPDRRFEARVARTAGRLDAKSRTLRVELEVPNSDGKLLPGMYANVELSLATAHDLYTVPASAVLAGKDGTKVALVDASGRVHLRSVLVERDNGSEVEIASGLSGDDQLIANPGLGMRDGAQVRPTS